MDRKSLYTAIIFLLLSAAGAWAAGEIYSFTDEAGTIHFSNVPTDNRYRPLIAPRPTGRSIRALHAMIRSTALRYGLDPELIRAVVKVESNFDPHAVSRVGALGLMQLMPQTADRFNVVDPFNPEENVAGGSHYLSHLMTLFENDLPLALAAYHAGEGRVIRFGAIPPIPATVTYVERVLKNYRRYRGETRPLFWVENASGGGNFTHRPERFMEGASKVLQID